MKILLINYRYFVSGGPERYMFNVKHALEEQGHTVVPFSISYPGNLPCEYSTYFVPPLDESGSVYFHEHKANIKTYSKTLGRLFYSREVGESLERLIIDTKPDVAYVLHYLRKLSPSVLNTLKKMNVPIVVRLSDYQMLCPQTHCLRDNAPCEKCVSGSLYPSIKYKCVKNSRIASILNFSSTKFHLAKGYFDYIDRFVVTNEFAKKMMIKGGYGENRLEVIPTFVFPNNSVENLNEGGDYITYTGRIDPIKGVDLVIQAFIEYCARKDNRDLRLFIMGEGNRDYIEQLITTTQVRSVQQRIEFKGHLSKEMINIYLRSSLLNIVPSRCYENLPNVILESFSAGTPVVTSNIGMLPEVVIEGQTGGLFEVGNSKDLADTINRLLSDRDQLRKMGETCKQIALDRYSENIHVTKLLGLFDIVTKKNKEGLSNSDCEN